MEKVTVGVTCVSVSLEVKDFFTFGAKDSRGRVMGCVVNSWVEVLVANDLHHGSFGLPGTHYRAIIQTTRDGKRFGTSYHYIDSAYQSEREHIVAKKVAHVRTMAAKAVAAGKAVGV